MPWPPRKARRQRRACSRRRQRARAPTRATTGSEAREQAVSLRPHRRKRVRGSRRLGKQAANSGPGFQIGRRPQITVSNMNGHDSPQPSRHRLGIGADRFVQLTALDFARIRAGHVPIVRAEGKGGRLMPSESRRNTRWSHAVREGRLTSREFGQLQKAGQHCSCLAGARELPTGD